MITTSRHAIGIAWYPHHLEHLIPICAEMGAQVLTLNGGTERAARTNFPDRITIPLFRRGPMSRALIHDPVLRQFISQFKIILISHLFPRDVLSQAFGSLGSSPRVVFCPHGFSEKVQDWVKMTSQQDIVLMYGSLGMVQLEELNVSLKNIRVIRCGNYRSEYYDRRHQFFSHLVQRRTSRPSLSSAVLYAPTWKDAISSSSISHALEELISTAPPRVTLIIKPHPLLELQCPSELESAVAGRDRVVLLRNTPITLPLLRQVGGYIGDMSSIAYDYLKFQKPMVFLNENKGAPTDPKHSRLFKCGPALGPSEYREAFHKLSKDDGSYRDLQRFIYDEVYDKTVTLREIAEAINANASDDPPEWLISSR